jgi:hypothetical protein
VIATSIVAIACTGDDPEFVPSGAEDASSSIDAATSESGSMDAGGDLDASQPDAPRSYREAVLADGPKAYLRLGEASGAAASDELATYNGTYAGGVTLGADGALSDPASTSVLFGGVDGRVEMGDVLDFVTKQPFSIEAWIRPAALVLDRPQTIVAKLDASGDGGTVRKGYLLQIDPKAPGSPNSITFAFWNAASAISFIQSSAPPAVGVFTHVVATFDGAQARLYFNGVEVGSGTANVELPNTAASLSIGAWSSLGMTRSALGGEIDEVAIYDKALPPARIQAHFAMR